MDEPAVKKAVQKAIARGARCAVANAVQAGVLSALVGMHPLRELPCDTYILVAGAIAGAVSVATIREYDAKRKASPFSQSV